MSATCLYEGTVRHRRIVPVEHAFAYRLFLAYIDLDDLPGALDAHPLWSARRRAAVWFRRADYVGDPALPIDGAVRDLVEKDLGSRPAGPIRLLSNLRTFGWNFNPLSIYYCFDPDGVGLHSVMVEVTNTPWGERCQYVFGAAATLAGDAVVDKALHVSPFLPMELSYRFGSTLPGDDLRVRFDIEGVFGAGMELRRRPMERRSMTRLMCRHPLMPMRVSAAIYTQAARLRLKGTPVHPRRGRARVG